jgi:Platelet-activating factor acetylhydrolase, isoform II
MLIFIFIAGVIGIISLTFWLIPTNPFPSPSGQWRVGTTEMTWDSSSHIGIIAKIWYPTDATTGINSPYVDRVDRITGWLNSILKLIYRRITTPAFINAPFLCTATPPENRSPAGFPLILLSPALGAINLIYTVYALEFASHGFIVIGINHPGSSGNTFLADGSSVKFNNIAKEVSEDIDRFESLAFEIAVQQSQNLSMVLDAAIELNSTTNSFLCQSINISKIFAVGHSIGGTASFIACGQDSRIAKGINFDGYSFIPEIDTDYTGKKLLLFNSDFDKYRPKNKTLQIRHDAIVEGERIRIKQLAMKANLQEIMMPLSKHSNFTDFPLTIRPAVARAIGFVGKIDGLEMLRQTSIISIDFLNRQNN